MTDRKPLLWATALLLPIVGLAVSWVITHSRAQQGTDWEVPIRGYDPRDLLRGHYIIFQYDWPKLKLEDRFQYIDKLCVKGVAPVIDGASMPRPDGTMEPGCAVIAIPPAFENDGYGLGTGRLYVPQTQARGYEEKLANPRLQGIARIRIRADGLVRPISISFRPRPPEPSPPQR